MSGCCFCCLCDVTPKRCLGIYAIIVIVVQITGIVYLFKGHAARADTFLYVASIISIVHILMHLVLLDAVVLESQWLFDLFRCYLILHMFVAIALVAFKVYRQERGHVRATVAPSRRTKMAQADHEFYVIYAFDVTTIITDLIVLIVIQCYNFSFTPMTPVNVAVHGAEAVAAGAAHGAAAAVAIPIAAAALPATLAVGVLRGEAGDQD
ncbi:uncharacterized protein LOC135390615 isoform X2 [Ornithodoros turicata]